MRTVSEKYLPAVVGVAVLGDHLLRLLFSDGTVGDVDFSREHWTGILEPLNDPQYFAQVEVDAEAGTVVWPDGIDLAPEPLYEQTPPPPRSCLTSARQPVGGPSSVCSSRPITKLGSEALARPHRA